jgi:hypothetical protein
MKASSDAVTGLVARLNGQPQFPAGDELGRAWVRLVQGNAPSSATNPIFVNMAPSPGGSPTRYAEFGTTAAANIKATPALVFACQATNTPGGALRWLQLHNTAGVPAGGAAPLYSFMLPLDEGEIVVGDDFWTDDGGAFSVGLAFAISSARGTYVAAGVVAAEHDVHVHYM